MSHIYEALEKAEQERNKQTAKDEEINRLRPSKQVISLPSRQFDVPSFPLFQTGSLAAEQFRKLRTFLIKKQPLKTIMVTSALQSEGKTFISANLAMGIAFDLQLHALLVDCDLRNPSLGSHFGLAEGKGLSDFLLGRETIPNLLTRTKLDKLNLIPGGKIPDNPAELIGSKKMENMVEEFKNRYDDRFIILDTTPILATSEPEILAKVVDGIILVVRAGFTPRETVQQAINLIGKEKLLGIILNQVEFKSPGLFKKYFGSNGYYGRYGYGYGYGKKKKK
ncbi:MAG: polysaccharide biosynthesis tyrosine autokinase [Thermodesulfobacteriota bacterium]